MSTRNSSTFMPRANQMPLFLPDPESPLHRGETELERETRLYEVHEATVNSAAMRDALKAQEDERQRIQEQVTNKSRKRKRKADPVANEATQASRFKAMMKSKERGTQKEKEEWPGFKTLVSHDCFFFHQHIA
jgi:hypothetical protein